MPTFSPHQEDPDTCHAYYPLLKTMRSSNKYLHPLQSMQGRSTHRRSIRINRSQDLLVFLSTIHKGPYEEVDVVYSKLFEYVSEHSLVMSGPAGSIYFNDSVEVSEDELLTEVQIPVNEI